MCDQCDDSHAWFWTDDHIQLRLQRHVPGDAGEARRRAVLLLHGGSANHRTFTRHQGLADWLFCKGFDPWLLDWRGSSLVSDCPQNADTLRHDSTRYTFNSAASEDVPAAIAIMRAPPYSVEGPIALAGHCMGAAVIAEAVARGCTKNEVDRIVLLALGLFYEAAIDSRVKSEERILERLTLDIANIPCIDPRVEANGKSWPADLNKLYEAWPGALRAHDDKSPGRTAIDDMCNRISFMYGMPYRHDNLATGIHTVPDGADQKPPKRPELPDHFGGFPLQMYLHAARNLREGQATWFNSTGRPPIVSDGARKPFIALTQVTLITGESNRLWHRDSIDRMHEWLCRGDSTALRKIKKLVLPNYAHQDLLWGTNSADQVFPRIGEGLGLPIVKNTVGEPPESESLSAH